MLSELLSSLRGFAFLSLSPPLSRLCFVCTVCFCARLDKGSGGTIEGARRRDETAERRRRCRLLTERKKKKKILSIIRDGTDSVEFQRYYSPCNDVYCFVFLFFFCPFFFLHFFVLFLRGGSFCGKLWYWYSCCCEWLNCCRCGARIHHTCLHAKYESFWSGRKVCRKT